MQDKVCVVTGAGTGIGRAIAERLAGEGALTLCADIDADAVQATAAGIEAAGGRAEAHVCDVSDADQVEAVMAAAERRGGPHAIVSNAAVQYERTVEDTPPDDWDMVLGVNLKGVYLCARAAIPRMRALGGGSIVNMASVNGFWVEPALGAYCAAKGAVINLTRSIALENGRYGIRCNVVCPGLTLPEAEGDVGGTSMWHDPSGMFTPEQVEKVAKTLPLRKVGRPTDIANAVVFFASPLAAGHVTGQVLSVSGGYSMIG